ncbi:hypothetical protein MMC25_000736 [Agyrium rufum]|nr:hypothetical protein [Agyrium rufum]
MDWPYKFSGAVSDRRQLLDSNSLLAQIAVLIPISLISLWHQIPELKNFVIDGVYHFYLYCIGGASEAERKRRKLPGSAAVFGSRANWWLDEEIVKGSPTRRQSIVAGLWALWLGFCVVRETGNDYLQLTKRFAIVAASQLPLHYILSIKSPYSPIQSLTYLSHEELNPYHRLLGRILSILFTLHALFYLNFYIQVSVLAKRIRDPDVQLGLLALFHFLTVNASALQVVRNYSYRLFYGLHIVLSFTILPVLWFHVEHVRDYVLKTAIVYGVSVAYTHLVALRKVKARIEMAGEGKSEDTSTSSSTNIAKITLTVPRSWKFSAGQHIYIRLPNVPVLPFFPLNPFSIASAPSESKKEDKKIELLIRTLNGPTSILSQSSSTKAPLPTSLSVSEPYGASQNFPDLLSYDRVLFFAGGIGATFTMPLYIDLLSRLRAIQSRDDQTSAKQGSDDPSDSKAVPADSLQVRTPQQPSKKSQAKDHREGLPVLQHIWTVRSYDDIQWAISDLQPHPLNSGFQVFISQGKSQKDSIPGGGSDLGDETPRFQIQSGRPDFDAITDEILKESSGKRIAVLVCGPKGLERDVRKSVGQWVYKEDLEVWWHAEGFGW